MGLWVSPAGSVGANSCATGAPRPPKTPQSLRSRSGRRLVCVPLAHGAPTPRRLLKKAGENFNLETFSVSRKAYAPLLKAGSESPGAGTASSSNQKVGREPGCSRGWWMLSHR